MGTLRLRFVSRIMACSLSCSAPWFAMKYTETGSHDGTKRGSIGHDRPRSERGTSVHSHWLISVHNYHLRGVAELKVGSDLSDDSVSHSVTETRNMDLPIEEFDKQNAELREQLHLYKANRYQRNTQIDRQERYADKEEMDEMRLKLESVIKENPRLQEQPLGQTLENQPEAFSSGTVLTEDMLTEHELIKNLQEQLQIANQEKEQALDLYYKATEELDHVQQLYQEHTTQAHIHVAERQQQKDQLAHFQHHSKQLQAAHEKVEMSNQQFLQTVKDQNLEIEQLSKELRKAKLDLGVATSKLKEITKLSEDLEKQMQKKEEDVLAAQHKEDAADKRVHELQSALTELETRLRVTTEDAEQFKAKKTELEKQVEELLIRCSDAEDQNYLAVSKVRESLVIVEEANLQKDQALLREQQKEEEITNLKVSIAKLIQEAAVKIRREVENVKKLCNVQISRLTEEMSVLQMDCGEKQSQIDRALREKLAAEEELEKVYREHRGNENDNRKFEALHQRCVIAERAKDDLQISLHTTQKKMRQLELNSAEELSRCQETVQKLNRILESEREGGNTVSEERLKLVQENEKLRKEVEEWKKSSTETQQKMTFQMRTMAQEFSVKEQGLEVQLQEMEDGNRRCVNELMKLLMAQQKAASRWKEETQKLTESTESRLGNLRRQLKQQKRNNEELSSQVETAHGKNIELEKLITEYQAKSNRLQTRLQQAEERALSASQQLKLVASQRRNTAHNMDLNIKMYRKRRPSIGKLHSMENTSAYEGVPHTPEVIYISEMIGSVQARGKNL
ncbi:LOW QUALITY PROTEIN: sodium channel and clathrin linker 1 [Pelodytes ibericus]